MCKAEGVFVRLDRQRHGAMGTPLFIYARATGADPVQEFHQGRGFSRYLDKRCPPRKIHSFKGKGVVQTVGEKF